MICMYGAWCFAGYSLPDSQYTGTYKKTNCLRWSMCALRMSDCLTRPDAERGGEQGGGSGSSIAVDWMVFFRGNKFCFCFSVSERTKSVWKKVSACRAAARPRVGVSCQCLSEGRERGGQMSSEGWLTPPLVSSPGSVPWNPSYCVRGAFFWCLVQLLNVQCVTWPVLHTLQSPFVVQL